MATVTVTMTPPVEPVIEKVTLELSEAEARAVLGVFGGRSTTPICELRRSNGAMYNVWGTLQRALCS